MRPACEPPKGYAFGPWFEAWQCGACKKIRDVMTGDVFVCPSCGAREDKAISVRTVRPTLLTRALCLLTGRPQPQRYVEVRG